jgi:transcriptional regulator with XRE-family HTH domain
MNDSRNSRLGAALKALRLQKGWTLSEMSQKTGFSVTTLSRVENNRTSLTYDKLDQVCERLSIDISELFAPPAGANNGGVGSITGRRSINRLGDGHLVPTRNYEYRYLSTDVMQKKFIPILGQPNARTIEEFGELVRHSGEEFVYVIEGEIEVRTNLYAPFTLVAGESAYLDSAMGHAYLRKGEGPARVLAICSASEAHLQEILKPAAPITKVETATRSARKTKKPRKAVRRAMRSR